MGTRTLEPRRRAGYIQGPDRTQFSHSRVKSKQNVATCKLKISWHLYKGYFFLIVWRITCTLNKQVFNPVQRHYFDGHPTKLKKKMSTYTPLKFSTFKRSQLWVNFIQTSFLRRDISGPTFAVEKPKIWIIMFLRGRFYQIVLLYLNL